MNNTVTVAEIKRRGMAAIEDGLRRGPLHIVKRKKPAAVVLSEDEYLPGGAQFSRVAGLHVQLLS